MSQRRKLKICNFKATVRGDTLPDFLGTVPRDTRISRLCPRACKVCPDQCKDHARTFIFNGRPRKCFFLNSRGISKQKAICNSLVETTVGPKKKRVRNLCRVKCGKLGIGPCGALKRYQGALVQFSILLSLCWMGHPQQGEVALLGDLFVLSYLISSFLLQLFLGSCFNQYFGSS